MAAGCHSCPRLWRSPAPACAVTLPSPSVSLLASELLLCSRVGWCYPQQLCSFCQGKAPLKGPSAVVGQLCHPPSSHWESWELRKHMII